MSAPAVTLLMPNLDNAAVLPGVLERLSANTDQRRCELLVIDDGSTDGSLEVLRSFGESGRFSGFRLIEREHGGVADALNAGLAEARGELVVQLDADALVDTPGWLERMVSFLESDERIGVVTAKVVFDWGAIHACGVSVVGPEGLHDRGSRIAEPAGHRTYHQRVTRPRERDCVEAREIAEVDGGIGCCMLFRREDALAAGGYDTGFAPVWFDDLDLSLAIRRLGRKAFFLPDVRVVHMVRRPPLHLRVARLLGFDRPQAAHRERLAHHYAYWREKWGFDMLNPDMAAVEERWGGTEVCWRTDPALRAEGERIAAAFGGR